MIGENWSEIIDTDRALGAPNLRKIIASEFVSADGYVVGEGENMDWVMGRFNDEMAKYAGDLMNSMDSLLLGRVTYQIMANAWPNWTEAQSPGADKMNNTPKFVLSRSLNSAPWGKYDPATLIKDDVERRIMEMKEKPGKNIVIYGSASVVQNLTELKLIDEYQLLVHPVFLGSTKSLFGRMPSSTNLKHLRTDTFSNGVNILYYALES